MSGEGQKRTHYEILGVGRDATSEQIKRRFRQLARQHHPDVARDKTASHHAFVEITEAYHVLLDPLRRADYDLMLRDRERRQPPPAGASSASGPSTGPRSQPPPSASHRGSASRSSPPPRTAHGAQRTPSGAARPQGPRVDAARLIRSAQAAYAGLRYRDAIRYLETALQADPRNAAACSLLGDVFRVQGKVDEAVRYYTLAIQFDPHNVTAMQKLDRLIAQEKRAARGARPDAGTHRAPRTAHASAASAAPRARAQRAPAPMTRRQLNQRMFVGAFGFALALFLMMLLEHTPGEPFNTWPWISHWTAPLVWLMAIDGMLVGATLSAARMVRPIDEELLLPSLAGANAGVPLGLLLFLLGALFFYMGVAMYTLIGLMQDSFSSSVLAVFLATFALVICFAVLAPEHAASQVMLFGGNVIFVCMLAGWFVGDFFRPLWS